MAGNATFVAVGEGIPGNTVGYSIDGSGNEWTLAANSGDLSPGIGGYGIAYGYNSDGSGVFVAVGGNTSGLPTVNYSSDNGNIWTTVSTGLVFNGGFGYAVGYGNAIFVAVGSGNTGTNIGYSTNGGETWVVAANTGGLFQGLYGRGRAIAYGNLNGSHTFAAVGYSTNDMNIGYSTDGGGNIWQAASVTHGLFQGGAGNGIAYGYNSNGSGVFVAVGQSTDDLSSIGFSLDGGDIWQVPTNTRGLFQGGIGYGIAYGSGVFVAVGSSTDDLSNIGYSIDGGDTWQVATDTQGLFNGGTGRGIAYDGSGVFVVVGSSISGLNNIGYSSNGGQTWRVATGTNNLFQDGTGRAIAFSLAPTPPPSPIYNICFPAETPIKTDQGIVPIEKLQLNINKYTINKQPIQHITKTITQDPYLICFEKNALGPNIPSEKTIMTKEHKILFEGHFRPAAQFLTQSKKVKKVKYNGEILYNVLLENYGTMQVNNLVCETLHPDNLIAKLYNNYNEAERPELVCQLNTSLIERNAIKYKAVKQKISHK